MFFFLVLYEKPDSLMWNKYIYHSWMNITWSKSESEKGTPESGGKKNRQPISRK